MHYIKRSHFWIDATLQRQRNRGQKERKKERKKDSMQVGKQKKEKGDGFVLHVCINLFRYYY